MRHYAILIKKSAIHLGTPSSSG